MFKSVITALAALTLLPGGVLADSITIVETWKDTADAQGNVTSKTTGTLTASLTIPGLSAITTNDWENFTISQFLTPFQGSQYYSDYLWDAPSSGGSVTGTSATFFFQGIDNNGNLVNFEKIVFSRSGNTLSIVDQVLSPNASPPPSLLAANYLNTNGVISDSEIYDLEIFGPLDSGDMLDVPVEATLTVTGTNKLTTDTFGNQLNDIRIKATADFTAPTISFTSPTANQQWSNSLFTIAGKAADNVLVTNVSYSLNSSGWLAANTPNGWTNWTAPVTLMPGTNTMQAYSMDSSGNVSPTNKASVVYILSAPLTVNRAGLGNISPNYNGTLLALGKNYSMTAKGTNGFMFTNWTGSSLTNGPTLIFTMASNLTFTANFVDTNRPTITITNLVAGQRVSNAVFTVTGKAGDNWQVSNVTYQVNGTGWTNAVTANNWTNWSAALNLNAGTNKFQAFATDTSGNVSTTNNLNFVYVLSTLLQIQTTGLGKLSPNYSNAMLAVGQNYSITSSPAAGFKFTNWIVSTNWIGGAIFTRTNLQFMMVSNLTLQANFVDVTKPTVAITKPTAGQKLPSAVVAVTGTASDNWAISGVWYQFNGGNWELALTTNKWTNWSQTLPLAVGTNTLKAYALDLGGNYSITNTVSFVSSNSFKLQLVFNSASPVSANGLAFSLQLSTNLTGHIQYSTNLLNWLNLTNFNGTNATLNFRDTAATNSAGRFYRATIP